MAEELKMTSFTLTDDERLILFEFLSKLDENGILRDLAEELVVNNVIAELESKIAEVFDPDYDIAVQKAKERFLEPYLEE